jgi:cytochrome oxidase Cu insertion factor (SCO1/SenC/PrrC family)
MGHEQEGAMMLRGIRWVSYGLIALVLLGTGAYFETRPSPGRANGGVSLPGGVTVGGPFSLIDDTGKPVTDATYHGRWMLVYFGYTFCPDVCPTELQTIAGALDKIGPLAKNVAPLFITVDPERDTQTAMAQYVKLFDDRIVGLTGTPAQIAAAAKAYRVYYAKTTPKDSSTYLMDHSSFMYLMGPDGRLRTLFPQGLSADKLADALRAQMTTS